MRKITAFLVVSLVVRGLVSSGEPGRPPLRVHMISGSREYKSEPSLTALKAYLEESFNVKCTLSPGRDGGRDLPGLEALGEADVMVVFCRRMRLPNEQLDTIKAWCQAGKSVVGIRTASHAFQTWLAFDKEVLGGDYKGHWGNEKGVQVFLDDKAKGHPILAGLKEWTRAAKHYRNPNLADDATVLLTRAGKKGEKLPLAWARTYRKDKGGRSFYTPMGLPSDFENATFRRLLVNAIFWTAKRDVEPKPPR